VEEERLSYVEEKIALQRHPIWAELEGDEPCKDPTVYTSSMLGDLADCSWMYYLKYRERIPEEAKTLGGVTGRWVHSTINRLHTTGKWGDWRDIAQEEREAEFSALDPDAPWTGQVDENSIKKETEHGLAMVSGYMFWDVSREPVIGTELQAFMVLQNPRTKTRYRLAARLDQIRMAGDSMSLPDIKSGKIEPNDAYLARSLQFTIYGLMLRYGTIVHNDDYRKFERFPDTMGWVHLRHLVPYERKTTKQGQVYMPGDLRGNPWIPVFRTEDQYLAAQSEVCRMIQRIRMGLYTHDVGLFSCKMCRYQSACNTSQGPKDDLALADVSEL
jgi:hypothetical protein